MELACVTVDCADPGSVASFWSQALHWNTPDVTTDGSAVVCRPHSGGAYLEFVRVREPKSVKNRVHLGCSAGPIDSLDDELGRLQSLGATIAWEEQFPPEIAAVYRNVVLRDVEGNEFCLGAGDPAPAQPGRDDVVVRDAGAHDRPRILQLAERLAVTTPPWRDPTAVQQEVAASMTALLANGGDDVAVFVADAGGAVVGFITVSQRRHFTGQVDGSIDDLAVDEQWEGRGVASLLIEEAERWARQHSLGAVTVETAATNGRALRRYHSHGFLDEDVRLTKHLGR
jgi:ribosomal protein S18 acetylase RimI-like enzyme